MCGIFGVISNGFSKSDAVLFLKPLSHRGPDDSGVMYWDAQSSDSSGVTPNNVCFGHLRLSIIDTSYGGHQPMGSSDGRWWLVYNGEIYNYQDLKIELESEGHSFQSRSDTEVVLTALKAWGTEKALAKFDGMFAFALLDAQEQVITLARDRFGIKPLYFSFLHDGFAFSSEISPLLHLPLASGLGISPDHIWRYLRFGDSDYGSDTMLSGIKQVPPASWCQVDIREPNKGLLFNNYWKISPNLLCDISFEDAVAKFRKVFLESIRMHLISDVPLGVALSGGLDSSAIVCAIRYLEPNRQIHTFSYVSEDPAGNEEYWVDLINKNVGAISHKVKIGADDLSEDFEALVAVQGEPFATTSIYAQYCVYRAAHECGIKVILDGQGADEQLGGYIWHQGYQVAGLFRRGQFSKAIGLLQAQRDWGRSTYVVLAWTLTALAPQNFLQALRRLFLYSDRQKLFKRKWFIKRGVNMSYPYKVTANKNQLKWALINETCASGLPRLLRYQDRNSMAWSIESRVPFLTRDLAEFLASLPESYLVGDDGSSKRVMREALRGIVPDEILNRKDKIGFSTPESLWIKNLLKKKLKSLKLTLDTPYIDLEKLTNPSFHSKNESNFFIWRIINILTWIKNIPSK